MLKKIVLFILIFSANVFAQDGVVKDFLFKNDYGINSFIRWEKEPLISGQYLLLAPQSSLNYIKYKSKIICWDLEQRNVVWHKKFKEEIKNIYCTSNAFFIGLNNKIIALSNKDGNTLWMRKFNNEITSNIISTKKQIIVFENKQDMFYNIDLKTGKITNKAKAIGLKDEKNQMDLNILPVNNQRVLLFLREKLFLFDNFKKVWSYKFRSDYFPAITLDTISKKNEPHLIITNFRTLYYINVTNGNVKYKVSLDDNYYNIEPFIFKGSPNFLANYDRGAVIYLNSKLDKLWEFYNPANSEAPSTWAKLFTVFMKIRYNFTGEPLIKDNIIITQAGGRIYLLNMNGDEKNKIDLIPHDNNLFNSYIEAKYPLFFYKDYLIAITSNIAGKITDKDNPGKFEVSDYIFYIKKQLLQ